MICQSFLLDRIRIMDFSSMISLSMKLRPFFRMTLLSRLLDKLKSVPGRGFEPLKAKPADLQS